MLTIFLFSIFPSTSNHLYIFYIWYILYDKVLYISKLGVKDTNFNHLHQKLEKRVLRPVGLVGCKR